jgi:hypothetical protein
VLWGYCTSGKLRCSNPGMDRIGDKMYKKIKFNFKIVGTTTLVAVVVFATYFNISTLLR